MWTDPQTGHGPGKGCSEDPVQLPHRTEEVAWQPTTVFWPGESHGQGRLVGYSPWSHRVGHEVSDWACPHTRKIKQR